MRKNILVTGCAGFIGSAISKKLIDNQYNVFGIDNLSTGKKKNIPKNLKFVIGSCNNQKTLNKFKNINFFQ